jgi:hypothetical protein
MSPDSAAMAMLRKVSIAVSSLCGSAMKMETTQIYCMRVGNTLLTGRGTPLSTHASLSRRFMSDRRRRDPTTECVVVSCVMLKGNGERKADAI